MVIFISPLNKLALIFRQLTAAGIIECQRQEVSHTGMKGADWHQKVSMMIYVR